MDVTAPYENGSLSAIALPLKRKSHVSRKVVPQKRITLRDNVKKYCGLPRELKVFQRDGNCTSRPVYSRLLFLLAETL